MQNSISHLAMIMDGNGRWAQGRGLMRLKGHEMGAKIARKMADWVKDRQIPYLTLYAFSTENWKRPKEEVDGIFKLLERFIDEEIRTLGSSGVRIHIIGDISGLSERLKDKIKQTMDETAHNKDLNLSIALGYGGRDEILRAAESIRDSGLKGKLDEDTFKKHLYTSFAPDPDLLIRTGGEKRISNFMLWQLAYSEIYFTDKLWPDFDDKALDEALEWFALRQRRFGMTGEQVIKL